MAGRLGRAAAAIPRGWQSQRFGLIVAGCLPEYERLVSVRADRSILKSDSNHHEQTTDQGQGIRLEENPRHRGSLSAGGVQLRARGPELHRSAGAPGTRVTLAGRSAYLRPAIVH